MLEEALKALVLAVLVEQGLVEAPKAGKGGKKAASKPAAEEDDGEITMETLKEKVTQLVNKKGKDAAKALLKKAKVEKLSELAEKHFDAFNKKLDEELAEDGDEDDLFGE